MKKKLYSKRISVLLSAAMVLGSMPINTAMAQDNLQILEAKQSDVQTVSVRVEPEITYEKDGTFYADIMLSNNQGINSYTLYVDYNPDVIQAVELDNIPEVEDMVNYNKLVQDESTGGLVSKTVAMGLSNKEYTNQLNLTPTQASKDYKDFEKADGTLTAAELGRIKLGYYIADADENNVLISSTNDGILMRLKFKMVGTGNSDIKITGIGNGFDAKPTDFLKLKTEYVNATVNIKSGEGQTETTTETTTEITTETTTETTTEITTQTPTETTTETTTEITTETPTETTTQTSPDLGIKFEDEEFGKAVKKQLGDIDKNAAASITELKLSDAEISKLNDLKYFPNLKTLVLSGNDIKDITPIGNLKFIEVLDLSNNIIRDVSALSGLTAIKELYVNDNRINDLSTIATLNNIEKLNISSTYIKDVSKVASLINIKYLAADENDINDISAVASLVNLEEVYLSDNSITNIDALKDLTNLKKVDISDNDIDFAEGSPAKSVLDALTARKVTVESDSKPITITSETLLKAIEEVLANLGIVIEDGKPITKEAAKKVEVLDLSEKELQDSDIKDLDTFNNVTEINLSSNNITDINVIKNMKKLSKLDVSNNNISDISVLVKLADNEDVSLMEAGGITEINLAGNNVSDISPLLQITTLEKVNITGNNLDLRSYLTETMNIIRTLKANGVEVTYDIPAFGDANGDGKVNVDDAAMVLERVLDGNKKLNDEDMVKFTNEKMIIANDAKEVLRRVLNPEIDK